ncbi:ABC transporter ATP-binding protein [Peloplasma aerotolerans]|jgi:peptide/nickel transport system ATP-binding protein|uniref:ABC transporter ATP-binding protein n=1 Tax=Peloplasma aerotolerans TaxID=3044389 RepID=A0AAW6U3M4_9MOLU|nr:ABC transporter ATP-binding protein [Mariniplasma sp. M4Ah]MDI6452571.1 ABC transporter ATP-binding protein [Mariniplasma sp. M4Ah]
MSENMLTLRNLKVVFPNAKGMIRAVEGIDLDIKTGECVALVGESGCGKSVTSLAIMRLLNSPPAVMRVDSINLGGLEIKNLSEHKMQEIRGKEISIIFQDAMTALNPVMTIGKQIDEIYIRHSNMSKKQARINTIKSLDLVGVPEAKSRANNFPHQLSGGMRQRVLIALAFACMPKLIIADEPTTALDVTIQAQVLEVLKNMQKIHEVSALLITHDLSVVANMADTVYVMYAGKIVEKASVKDIFESPYHPYTEALSLSVPKLSDTKHSFVQIPDSVPHPMFKPTGCYFHPRCNYATEKCKERMPLLKKLENGREYRCFYPRNFEDKKGDHS